MMIEIAFTLAYKNVRAVFFVFSLFALFEPDTVPFDVTLYAKWTKEAPKTAYLKTFSGKGISSTNYASGSNINIGTEVTVTATVKTGYKFVNWTDGNTNVKRTITVKDEATYTAYTKVIPYTISYNLNGGVSGV